MPCAYRVVFLMTLRTECFGVGDDACYWTTGRIIPVLFTVINNIVKNHKKILNNQTQTKPFLLIINLYTDLGNLISNDFYIFISYFYPSLGNCIYHNYAFINTLTDKSQHNSLEIKFFCVFLFSFKNYFTRTVNKMLECLIK